MPLALFSTIYRFILAGKTAFSFSVFRQSLRRRLRGHDDVDCALLRTDSRASCKTISAIYHRYGHADVRQRKAHKASPFSKNRILSKGGTVAYAHLAPPGDREKLLASSRGLHQRTLEISLRCEGLWQTRKLRLILGSAAALNAPYQSSAGRM